MKLMKTRLRNSLNDKSLSNLMKMHGFGVPNWTNRYSHLEEPVDVWNRKSSYKNNILDELDTV